MPVNPRQPRPTRNIDGFRIAKPQPAHRLSPFALHHQAAPNTASLRPGVVNRRPPMQPIARPAHSPADSGHRPPTNTHAAPTAPASSPTMPRTTLSYTPRRAGAAAQPKAKVRRLSLRRLKPTGWKKSVLLTGTLVLILFLAIGGWVGWKFYRNIAKLTHDNNPFSLLQVFHPVALKSQDGRVNVLIAGDSADRTDGQAGGQLTDSIMVLSIDTHNNTAFMLSIPRDLWVPLPSNNSLGTHQKINSAHEITNFNQAGYPQGGMGALEYVIQQNLGIPINYYALVNYSAFRDLVDALGGITVDIESPDPRGLYDPQPYPGSKAFKLANGVQTLNGVQALNLARARGEANHSYGFPQSDFTRTQHQRQMVLAIKDKASSTAVIANPFKVGSLLDAVGNNVTTDLKLNEIETLYSLTKKINDANIASDNINTLNGANTTLLANYTSPSGESALKPAAGLDDFSAIQKALRKLFSNNPLAKESANVIVLNAGNTVGLAKAEAAVLNAKGMTATAMTYSPPLQTSDTIIDNSGGNDPQSKAALQKLFGTNVVTSASLTRAYPGANFIVLLGTSQQMPATSTTSNATTTATGSTSAGD